MKMDNKQLSVLYLCWHPSPLWSLSVDITLRLLFSKVNVCFYCFSIPLSFPLWLSHTPSFLFLFVTLPAPPHHLTSVIMQCFASFAVWNAARHSGSLLAGWLIPVYLAPVEPAVITEPEVMGAVGAGSFTAALQVKGSENRFSVRD